LWYNVSVVRGTSPLLNKKFLINKEKNTMANVKKLTKADKFGMLLNIAEVKENELLTEFINHELELLAKKNSSEKKPTAQQTANKEIKEAILGNMTEGVGYQITDLIKTVPECAELTNQRVSALVRQLIAEGSIERYEEKRKAYFRLIAE
jgi:hypothetical protein